MIKCPYCESAVSEFANTGKLNFFDKFPKLLIWSECSCVTRIPSKEEGDTFMEFNPSSIFFKLTPASISNFVLSLSTNKQLPLLPLYKLQKFNICFFIL